MNVRHCQNRRLRLPRLRDILLAVLPLIAAGTAYSQDAPDRFEYRQILMGVETRIVLYAPDEESAVDAATAAFDRIAELEDIMSDYRESSELMQLAAAAGGKPRQVSDDLFRVLMYSWNMAVKTNGAFDVTAGPLVRLWRESRAQDDIPASDAIQMARKSVGWEKMILDAENQTVQLTETGMMLDLGGIGKGYAADEGIRILQKLGIRSAMIEMGGDVVVADAPPGRNGWRIRVPHAPPEISEIHIANRALSVSGDTEQSVEIDGTRYSHIVDPTTGYGLTRRTAVTVLAPEGIVSDAYSTAISVMGKEKGLALVDGKDEIEAYVVEIGPE